MIIGVFFLNNVFLTHVNTLQDSQNTEALKCACNLITIYLHIYKR